MRALEKKRKEREREKFTLKSGAVLVAVVLAALIQMRSTDTAAAPGPHPAATRIPARPESTKMDDAERASNWAHSAQTSLGLG